MAASEERRKAFGAVVREAREKVGWSQTRLAETLAAYLRDGGLAGADSVTQGAVTQWERGITVPRREKIHPLEVILMLQPGHLSEVLDGPHSRFDHSTEAARRPAALSGKIDKLTPAQRAAVEAIVDQMLGDEED